MSAEPRGQRDRHNLNKIAALHDNAPRLERFYVHDEVGLSHAGELRGDNRRMVAGTLAQSNPLKQAQELKTLLCFVVPRPCSPGDPFEHLVNRLNRLPATGILLCCQDSHLRKALRKFLDETHVGVA